MKTPSIIILLSSVSVFFSVAIVEGQILAVDFGNHNHYGLGNLNSTPATSGRMDFDADFDGSVDDGTYYVPFGTVFTAPDEVHPDSGDPLWTEAPNRSGAVIKQGVSISRLNGPGVYATGVLNRYQTSGALQVSSGKDGDAGPWRQATAFYWEKASFVNGADTAGPLSFADDAAGFSYEFSHVGTPDSGTLRRTHALVENSGQWFISSSAGSFSPHNSGNNDNSAIVFNPAEATWFPFNPSAEGIIFTDASEVTGGVLGSTFTDITALGWYAQHESITDSANHDPRHSFSDLQVMVVPEPSTYALLFGIGGLGFILLRRMRRS